MKRFTALHPRSYVADDVSEITLPLRVRLLVERAQALNQRNSGVDHCGELARKEHEVSFFDRPNPLPRTAGDGFLLEGEHQKPSPHEAGYSIIFIERVLNPRDDAARGVASLIGESDHIVTIIGNIAAAMPPALPCFSSLKIQVLVPETMPLARDLTRLLPGLFVWQEYDAAIKAELFSSAIVTSTGLYIVDPIPLVGERVAELTDVAPVSGVIVTNSNHRRAASDYANMFAAPIFAHAESFPERGLPCLIEIDDGQRIGNELEVVTIDGAAPGEIALYHSNGGGTLIVGDALINFEPYGFTFLPRKYCRNAMEMRRSLRKFLARQAERLLFAHGTPILSGASARLQQLLDLDL